eukprot:3601578-Pleurochrysis_carterae.AAC.1
MRDRTRTRTQVTVAHSHAGDRTRTRTRATVRALARALAVRNARPSCGVRKDVPGLDPAPVARRSPFDLLSCSDDRDAGDRVGDVKATEAPSGSLRGDEAL